MFLRGGADPDVPADRRVGNRPERVFGDETDADVDGRFGAAAGRHPRHLFPFGARRRSTVDEYSRNLQTYDSDERAVPVLPADVRRLRGARRDVSVPHVVAGRSRFGAYGRFDAACWGADETRRIRLFSRGDLPDARGGQRIGMDFPDADRYQRGLRSVLGNQADRPEIHQRLLFGQPLRTGAVRDPDAEPDRDDRRRVAKCCRTD